MANVQWTGNGKTIAQVDTITISIVPAGGGGLLMATISNKQLNYITQIGDTPATAAQNWFALLSSNQAPLEFQDIVWTIQNNVITATAASPGTPFTLSATATNSAVINQAHTQANVSPSDVANPNNWLRNNNNVVPQTGDVLILANSTIPLLWNLDYFAGTVFSGLTRYQSFQPTLGVGLPDRNPAGYLEYRPTYFQFASPQPYGLPQLILGLGATGRGPGRERYYITGGPAFIHVLASGQALDDYAIRLLLDNSGSQLLQSGSSVGLATGIGESSGLATATVDGGGLLALGAGVLYGIVPPPAGTSSSSPSLQNIGILDIIGSTLLCASAPGTLIAEQGSTILLSSVAEIYWKIIAEGGSLVRGQRLGGRIDSITLLSGSILDKSGDVLTCVINNAGIAADCQVLDPNNAIVWNNPVAVQGAITSGIFVTGFGRMVQVI